jgi:hypothetical protein
VNCYFLGLSFCGAETWTLRKADQKYLGSPEMWFWKRMVKISWTDRVENKEVLRRDKEERNILRTIKRRNYYCICHILRRNSFIKLLIEGEIEVRTEVTGRRGKGRTQILDGLKEQRGYWKLEERTPDCTVWRTRFGRGYGPVLR